MLGYATSPSPYLTQTDMLSTSSHVLLQLTDDERLNHTIDSSGVVECLCASRGDTSLGDVPFYTHRC